MSDRQAECGGIDVGGTKIEAGLYDSGLNPIRLKRRPTPCESCDSLTSVLLEEIARLRRAAVRPDLPVGIAFPGLVEQATGSSMTANLPADGHRLTAELGRRAGGPLTIANDCQCVALSEANGGAADDANRMFGLVLGTGVGGGFCRGGALDRGPNGLAGEVGHFGLPAHIVSEHDLPILPCGCGRSGCFETLVSGAGLARLGRLLAGSNLDGQAIAAAAEAGEPAMTRVIDLWTQLTAELLHTIQLFFDPDCIVIGGGLSRMGGITEGLAERLNSVRLRALRPPVILKPRHGDSSGGRGAALLALRVRRSR